MSDNYRHVRASGRTRRFWRNERRFASLEPGSHLKENKLNNYSGNLAKTFLSSELLFVRMRIELHFVFVLRSMTFGVDSKGLFMFA